MTTILEGRILKMEKNIVWFQTDNMSQYLYDGNKLLLWDENVCNWKDRPRTAELVKSVTFDHLEGMVYLCR